MKSIGYRYDQRREFKFIMVITEIFTLRVDARASARRERGAPIPFGFGVPFAASDVRRRYNIGGCGSGVCP
jgi:hypothetical protein